jgi:glutamate N-acetyltransferase/amino-acid N-acetyltransferase
MGTAPVSVTGATAAPATTTPEIFAGDVTSPAGFRASGVHCGLKKSNLDLALVVSDRPASVAGVFTTNQVKAAPVLYSQRIVASGAARAIVCNSGNANACTGDQGLRDSQETAALVAEELGLLSNQVIVASTGVIGVPLDMAKLRSGIPRAVADLGTSGETASRAIMTTDNFPKVCAARFRVGEMAHGGSGRGGAEVTIGGMTKGAGMIQPNMATTLCFVTTDAGVSAETLQAALRTAVAGSYNSITVDGDTSTNDAVIVLANGASGVRVENGTGEHEAFVEALSSVLLELAKMIVRDAEGGTKVIAIRVEGARDDEEARRAAFTIANSPLVKTAFYGCQANWGRILAAAGRAGVAMNEAKSGVWFNDIRVVRDGLAVGRDMRAAEAEMRKPEITVRVDLGVGEGRGQVWTSDLTEEYIRINGSYIS